MFVPGKISARQLICYGIFFLCAYAAWARGGTYPPLQWPLLIGTLLLCCSPLLLEKDRRLPLWHRIYADPVFMTGAVLMVLILFQWINSGYLVVLKETGGAEMARTPPKWFPWSVDRGEAGEMLVWFFPAWILVLFIRNLMHRKHVVALLYLLALNSALLACAGLVQAAVGSEKVLGIWAQPYEAFFASFGYVNHACTWFYMNAFLAGGLAYRAFIKRRPIFQVFVWSALSLLCIISTFLTLSRFGAFISLLLFGVFLALFIKHALKRFRGNNVINVYIVSVIIALFGLALFFGVDGGSLAREVMEKTLLGEKSISGDMSGRIRQMPLAWEIIKDYPLFGSGGWGYRWLTKIYIPAEEWSYWESAGKANVHCDPLQFLTEFGIAGFMCISAVLAVLVRDLVSARRSAVFYWVFGGLTAVFVHSFIDLPFRSPAILLEWSCLLAALPCLSKKRVPGEQK